MTIVKPVWKLLRVLDPLKTIAWAVCALFIARRVDALGWCAESALLASVVVGSGVYICVLVALYLQAWNTGPELARLKLRLAKLEPVVCGRCRGARYMFKDSN